MKRNKHLTSFFLRKLHTKNFHNNYLSVFFLYRYPLTCADLIVYSVLLYTWCRNNINIFMKKCKHCNENKLLRFMIDRNKENSIFKSNQIYMEKSFMCSLKCLLHLHNIKINICRMYATHLDFPLFTIIYSKAYNSKECLGYK